LYNGLSQSDHVHPRREPTRTHAQLRPELAVKLEQTVLIAANDVVERHALEAFGHLHSERVRAALLLQAALDLRSKPANTAK
jgi:hypothetical protein